MDPEDADRFEQTQRAERVGVGRVLRRLEAHLHVALGGQVVDLVGLCFLHDADQVRCIGEVAIVHEKARASLVRVDIEMIDTSGVERRRAALDAMDNVALPQQQLSKIGAVLPGHARDQCDLGWQWSELLCTWGTHAFFSASWQQTYRRSIVQPEAG